MKSVYLILCVTIMSSFSPITNSTTDDAASEWARALVSSLRNHSPETYPNLVPSLNEFLSVMDSHADFYGNYLAEAKLTFTSDYNSKIIPQVRQSFSGLIKEGNEKKIDWQTLEFIQCSPVKSTDSSFVFDVTVASNGKQFKIRMEQALFVNHHFYAGPSLKLL